MLNLIFCVLKSQLLATISLYAFFPLLISMIVGFVVTRSKQ